MNRKIYLAYGSNLNISQMAHRCPNAKVLGSYELKGYRLLFRGCNGGAVATIEKHEKGIVPVLIWEISRADEKALDRYEGYPHLYRKETLKVLLYGKPVSAMVYIMNEGRPLGLPSCYYYDVISKGYKSADFSESFLKNALRDSKK